MSALTHRKRTHLDVVKRENRRLVARARDVSDSGNDWHETQSDAPEGLTPWELNDLIRRVQLANARLRVYLGDPPVGGYSYG